MNRPAYLLGLLSIASLGLGGLGGCGSDAPAPADVRARISTDLVHVLDEANAATADGAAIPSAAAFGMVERVLGGVVGSALGDTGSETSFRVQSRLAQLAGVMAPRTGVRSTGTADELAVDEPADADFDGAAAAEWLNEHLLTDANHQGDGIYKVPAALVCAETQYDETGAPTGEAVDADCAQAFAQIGLRIRVTEDDDTLRFALQLGSNHDEPLSIGLAPNALSLTVDLDEAEDAMRSLASKFGEGIPTFSLAGQVTASLEILAAAHVRGALDIDRAIAIELAEPAAGDAFRFASAQANVFAITLNGAQQSSELVVGLGATSLHVTELEGAVDLDLPGVTAVAMHAAGQPLQITHVGLGDRTTSLSIDGQRAFSLDLNPQDGRAFGATISHDPESGTETVTVAPKLDLRMATDHAVLGDTAPVYDVTQLVLDGSLRSSAESDRVEVLTGSLRLATNPASYGFIATAGQCVAGTEVIDEPSDTYYTQWSVGSCQ
ncbi:MAG: hypothetical protein H0X17_12755 [Deltaproteobacteria bacterium]|nr:hypothetical protein [Deltaproteobacteria bacterium]